MSLRVGLRPKFYGPKKLQWSGAVVAVDCLNTQRLQHCSKKGFVEA